MANLRAEKIRLPLEENRSLPKINLFKHFETVKDPRIERSKEHLLVDIIAIAILAVLSGAEGWVAIETYGKGKYQWLKTFLNLPNGIPSHDTFSRVFSRINPEEFHQSFRHWVQSITEKIGVEVIAIDGKTIKQSYDRNQQQKALQIVSAWSSSHQLVLGQQKVQSKSNEITAIPELIKMLEIEGSTITIDSMGCQKEIASLIIDKKADYVLALKGNQKLLHQEVKNYFEKGEKEGFRAGEYDYYQQIEAGHNRLEKREVWAVPIERVTGITKGELWRGLSTVVMVKSHRKLGDKTTKEIRFYLSSLPNNAEIIAQAVRSHWGIENTVHWTLDVTFSEDKSRMRKDKAPENLALLRRLALNLLTQETSFKGSIKMKRYLAGIDNNYAMKILASAG